MKTLKNIILGLAISAMLPLASAAQNCTEFLNFMKPESPWRYNTASKSATCFSAKKYEFVLPLSKGNEYRIKFFASPVFNNDVQVKIVDLNSNQTLYDLPGRKPEGTTTPKKGETCLQDFEDPKTHKMVHPYFDFIPSQSTSLKIMIEVKEHLEYKIDIDDYGNQKEIPVVPEGGAEVVKGCFTVYVMDKPSDSYDF